MNTSSQENEIFVGREEEIALFKRCFEAILPENQGKEEYKDSLGQMEFWKKIFLFLKLVLLFQYIFAYPLFAQKESYERNLEKAQQEFNLGASEQIAGNYTKAIEHYKYAANTANTAYTAILALLGSGSKGEMKKKLEDALIKAKETIAKSNYSGGFLYLEKGDNQKAQALFSKALKTAEGIDHLKHIVDNSTEKLFNSDKNTETTNSIVKTFKNKAEEFENKAKEVDNDIAKKEYENLARRFKNLADVVKSKDKIIDSINSIIQAVELEARKKEQEKFEYQSLVEQEKAKNKEKDLVIIMVSIISILSIFILLILVFFITKIAKKKAIIEKRENQLSKILKEKDILLAEKELLEKENAEIEYNVIATMTHNLNQNFGAVLNYFQTLKMLIKMKENNQETGVSFEEILVPMEKTLSDATQTFNATQQILRQKSINPTSVNILDFFNKEIIPNYTGKNYEIQLIANDENLVAEIDMKAFKDILRNLITNAEKHGFEPENKYQIVFEFSRIKKYNREGKLVDFLSIIYKNNGKPFPKGFSFEDYKRLSIKSGKSSGAGIGGYFINQVIDLHKGEFQAISTENNTEYPIKLEILLPIQQTTKPIIEKNGVLVN
jgi:tetratricopeptide (TPR) repeat protein